MVKEKHNMKEEKKIVKNENFAFFNLQNKYRKSDTNPVILHTETLSFSYFQHSLCSEKDLLEYNTLYWMASRTFKLYKWRKELFIQTVHKNASFCIKKPMSYDY